MASVVVAVGMLVAASVMVVVAVLAVEVVSEVVVLPVSGWLAGLAWSAVLEPVR